MIRGSRERLRSIVDDQLSVAGRLLVNTALSIMDALAEHFNPLFIYGGWSEARTQLLQAIGHYATMLETAKNVRYVSTEQFTNDFINSVRDDKTNAFQRRYRDDVDILLIDDVRRRPIRELEGAPIRVTAFASLNRAMVDLALAEEVLRDFIPDGTTPELTHRIIRR